MAKRSAKPKNAAKPTNATKPKKPNVPETAGERLMPPDSGVTVRMYRTGHGDCFLLAFAGNAPDKPVYVLIDCGYKPGSPAFINTKIKEITKSIFDATGGHIDVAVITHEHQDHVNGITEGNFDGLTIGETWFAWTEDPEDDIANDLRRKFKDKLLGLIAARNQLAAAGDDKQAEYIDNFLAFELGGDDDQDFNATEALAMLGAAGSGPSQSMNKKSMKVFKDRAKNGVRYFRPHEAILKIPGAKDLRIFVLGPPRDPELLKTLDPEGEEEFHSMALASASAGNYFAAAAMSDGGGRSPFASRFCIAKDQALTDADYGAFFTDYYGGKDVPLKYAPDLKPSKKPGEDEVYSNPEWRRIDNEWLLSAEQLALDMNNQTNNASLVLAFELGKGGKVLLFAADAQRGNWLSWTKNDWKDDAKTVTARDLLSRTVLYKVGHHCSHNATLNGQPSDDYANLSWMADGDHGREFTAMITAVRKWAETQKGWDHPLKAIKDALLKKASGRVFQTDTDFDRMEMSNNGSEVEWQDFQSRAHGDRLYFDYKVIP